jgi:nucleotide-binding universal stress UspA family protein
MVLPLVVGTDGSDGALKAVDWAAAEAAKRGTPLRVLHASRWSRYEGLTPNFAGTELAERSVNAGHMAASAVERAQVLQPDLAVSSDVYADDPAVALIEASRHAAAVVVGSRGLGGVTGLMLGSVSVQVAGRAESPVVVVRHRAAVRAENRWAVLALGREGTSTAAVEYAFAEAELHGWGVEAVHAWMCPHSETATQHTGQFDEARLARQRQAERWLDDALAPSVAAHPHVRVRRVPVESRPQPVLVEAARSAELLVVGARRRHGAVGMQLGPVNHTVLHRAACPVVVVPEGHHADLGPRAPIGLYGRQPITH